MNASEAALRLWLGTDAGRVYASAHGGQAAALAELYRLDASDVAAARELQDRQEMTRGTRPDFGEAKLIVRAPAVGWLSGPTEDIVAALNRNDPLWRWQAVPEPEPAVMALPAQAGRIG